uniref:Gem-associated protein 5 TPR domain-containing protein n=1 Tax=Fusarium oxysporum (strain Fo5176) TaxID=660025 RepID=A0A0D2XSH1_FUSOF
MARWLSPRFTIFHNLTTSRGPSPIINLAWHAASSRQKSNMLAVQMHDGVLRVWSVAKTYSADDPAKIVRNLRKAETSVEGPNWMGWSKNGRIIQYSDSQTQSWDVRTKHVTHDPIPTLDLVRGLAVYGPGATLFTLGPNNTVQQFDLNSPAIMVANVQHPANLLPPSPPVSEETGDRSATSATTIASESETSSIPLYMNISESEEDHRSLFTRLTRRQAYDSGNEPYESASPVSSWSGLPSLSKSSAGSSQTPGRYPGSMRSRALSENTYISAGTSIRPSTIGNSAHGNTRDLDTYSMGCSLGTTNVPSMVSSRSRRRPSRLRNEVPRSPDDNKVHDLFKFTRACLSDIPYKHAMGANSARLTNDDLRRQMLNTIFGWNKEVEDLIRDEMSRHPQGSASRILLAKWLGDIDLNIMSANFENMTSSNWMLLALSGIGGHTSQQKLGHTYVQRLLEAGDVHTAVTIMLGMGDHNDAIEVYISHKRYMEALILTCLSTPSVWERQAAIIKKWGEWAVQHGQQQLATRCFACTDQESTEPWTSPSASQLNFQAMTPSIPEVLSPPLSPPGVQRGPQRSIAKTSALKLITSFGDQTQKSKFFADVGGQAPIAAGVTPIADSAGSPAFSHASNNEATTAFLRPSNNSRFNTPVSARGRGRLPSIGEIPSELNRDALRSAELSAVPYDYAPRSGHARTPSGNDNMTMGTALQRAATASPMMMREHAQRVVQPSEKDFPPPPDHATMLKMQQASRSHRKGSRDRITVGLNLQLQPGHAHEDVTSPEQSVTSSTRYHWPSRRRGPASVTSSVTSASSAGRHIRHQAPSPTFPIPMSSEDLLNLSTPRHGQVGEPNTVRKMKHERQRKKEQAARELEGSRKSLAKHAQIPSIPHPNEFSPAITVTVETAEPKPLPDDIPPRSATEPPQRSMYARNGPVIGRPATPKAIRLIIEGNYDLSGSTPRPDVPAIPAGFSQRYSPETSPQQSSEREQPVAEPSLTLLPSTVYQSPTRPPIPRSMSAPIPDKPGQPPARFARKKSVERIEEVVPGERRRSHEDPMPPPPPPAPPVLKELRHLASPPPPLPAPIQHAQRHQQAGAVASGMIEIVMDDDLSSGNDQASEASPPAATHKSHNWGRSIRDSSSISGRIHKATERLRSASRSRKEYVRSPPFEAPYESISMTGQMKSPPPVSFNSDALRSPTDSRNKHLSTSLNRNEMI